MTVWMRVFAALLAVPLAAAPALAQKKVKTETLRESDAAANAAKAAKRNGVPEILHDLSKLPEPVRKIREQILTAARTGDLQKVAAIMKAAPVVPVFSFGGDQDPAEFWKTAFQDSDGVEALAILIEVLESPFVQTDKGTAQEMFVWPYFHAMPLDKITPEQKVDLFKLVTAADWKEMQNFGAYNFYRVGISSDGTWHFFVAGD